MLRQMSARLFVEWQAFARLEPFGDDRADFRAAHLGRVIVKAARDPRRAYQPEEFLLRFPDDPEQTPTRRQTWQEQKRLLFAIAKAHNLSRRQSTAARPPK